MVDNIFEVQKSLLLPGSHGLFGGIEDHRGAHRGRHLPPENAPGGVDDEGDVDEPDPCGRFSRPPTTTSSPPLPLASVGDGPSRPPQAGCPVWNGTRGRVPAFTVDRFDGTGTQLCPCIIAMATPQAFTMASRADDILRSASSPPDQPHRLCRT